MFSVIEAVLLRPLPYAEPERLVRVWQNEPRMASGRLGMVPPELVSALAPSADTNSLQKLTE